MKEKDELLKLIEIWTGHQDTKAKIILAIICLFLIGSIVYIFHAICTLFKFLF